MAYTFLGSTSAGSTDGQNVTSPPLNTLGADLLVMATSGWIYATLPYPTDSEGNSWFGGAQGNPFCWEFIPFGQPGDFYCQQALIWFCRNPTTSAAHTFTQTSTSIFPLRPSVHVMAFRGVSQDTFPNNPVDQAPVYNLTDGAKTMSISSASLTPIENNCLVVSFLSNFKYRTEPLTAGALPIIGEVNPVTDQTFGGALTYQIQTTATPFQPTWDWTNTPPDPTDDDFAIAWTMAFRSDGVPPPSTRRAKVKIL